MTTPDPYPELSRRHAIIESGDSQIIGEFLEWAAHNGYHFTKTVETTYEEIGLVTNEPYTVHGSYEKPVGIEEVLAHYFNIDMVKVEEERRALLDKIRSDREQREPA